MKKTLVLVVLALSLVSLTGCGAMRNKWSKGLDAMGAKDYKVTVYSGGVIVGQWKLFNTFINSEEGTDGWFFYVNGKLVRVGGTTVIEEI